MRPGARALPAAVLTAIGLAAVLAPAPVARARGARAASDTCLPSASASASPLPGVGSADPFRPPDAAATALNADGRALYRQGKWEEARAKYRAAMTADPDFLAPALNVACSFVRQERFDEAAAEVIKLLDLGYVPWAREVLAAADLGALKLQPQMARVRQAMAANAARWGADLPDSLLFVARQREPLKLPPPSPSPATGAPVALVLALHQEVFAWSPATGRYRAVTAEDGRVLAMAQSADGQGLLYVTAEKLVRGGAGGPALRGVVLHTLALASMAPGPPVAVDGDVRRIAIAPAGTRFALAIDNAGFWLATGGAALVPSRRTELGRGAIVLGATGVAPAPSRRRALPGACGLVAREGKSQGQGDGGRTTIEIEAPGRKPFGLRPQLGAGLAGLAIP